MGELTTETFAEWLHPCDVIEYYHQQIELRPKELVTSMLTDGLLRAAARQLVLNGRDHGLALMPRETWRLVSGTEVWTTGHFQLTHIGEGDIVTISGYDVRIDPQIQDVSEPPPTAAPVPAPAATVQHRGGRPPAAWWDELWAEICRQLYVGDLKPDSQATIERAMLDWLTARGRNASETTVRTRARLLFQTLSDGDGN